ARVVALGGPDCAGTGAVRSRLVWAGVTKDSKKTARKAAKREKKARKHAGANGALRGISEIRRFFRTNETPVSFVSATAFNLLGIDRWVRRFEYVNFYDSFDGH